MQSFLMENIKMGTITLTTARVLPTQHALKEIGQSMSIGEIFLITTCLCIIIFAPLLIGTEEERLYKSLNSKRLRAEKAQELREDFPILYPIIRTITMFTLKVIVFLLKKTYDTLVEMRNILSGYVDAVNTIDEKMQKGVVNVFRREKL